MIRWRRWLLYTLVAVGILIGLGSVGGYLHLKRSLPQTAGRIGLSALDTVVTVTRSKGGIPTIEAQSLSDAYTALGFVHAQDRLWQMDFMRRTAQGRLAAVAGPPVLGLDKFMRTLGFHELAKAQAAQLSPRTREALRAYAAGVNAFLATNPVLPPEFHLLRYAPTPWTVADSLAWMHIMALQLSGNWREELQRARLAKTLTREQMASLYDDKAPAGPATIGMETRASRELPFARLAKALPYPLQPKSASNAWVLGGNTTASGKPLLANDPHLNLQAPGYWYLARIETPEHTLAGATSPGIPFTVLGRNKHLAWGLTTTHSDTQDLFIEKVDPDNAKRYLTPEGPQPFTVRAETIEVAGRDDPVEVRVRSSRHGPIISDTVESAGTLLKKQSGHVLALNWTALTPRDRTLEALHRVNLAADVPAALDSFNIVGSPQQNIHLADDQGNIAVTAPGHVPIRKKGNGMRPMPGWTGEYDWRGLIPLDALPRTVNPADGRIVNANNRLVPESYPYMLTASWPPPDRAERIRNLLDGGKKPFTPAMMRKLQLDAKSPAAQILLPMLLDYPADTGAADEVHAMLHAWNGEMDRSRPEPLIFVAWMDKLNRALLADELGTQFDVLERPDPRRLRRFLEEETAWCDDITTKDRTESCEIQVQDALASALADLSAAYGDDPKSWAWGDAHRAALPHPALSRIPVIGSLFDNPIATDGGDETINRGSVTYQGQQPAARYEHRQGPGLRAIHDLSQPLGSSLFMIADGQSGNPLSEHYASFATAWRGGRYVKLVGETQDSAARLRLTPANH